MSTIAEELTRIQNAKASLATSIAAKGVAVPAATKIDGYAALVDQISQGAPTEPPMKALCFYDYDGTRLYSFDEDEVAAMTELPALPDHTDKGLVQEGWNWTLADIKTQIQLVGACDVGCTYATNDGKNHIRIRLDDENYMSPSIECYLDASRKLYVDWGDGTPETEYSSKPSHTYTSLGDYTIKMRLSYGYDIVLSNGILSDGIDTENIDSLLYRKCIKELYFCDAKIRIGASCMEKCSLDVLCISKSASIWTNTNYHLRGTSAPAIIYASENQSLLYYHSILYLADVKVLSLMPKGVSSAQLRLSGCGMFRYVAPYNVSAEFSGIRKNIYLYTPVSGSAIAQSAYGQRSYKLHRDGASTIPNSSFANNYCLEQIEFHEYDTVPTLSNVGAFSNCPEGFKIIVPQSLYEEWKAATNWSTFASYIYYRDSNGDLKQ